MKKIVFDANHPQHLAAKLSADPSLEHEYDCNFSQKAAQNFNIDVLSGEKDISSQDLVGEYLRLNKANLPSSISNQENHISPRQNLKQKFYDEVFKAMGELFLLSTLTTNLSHGKNYDLMDVFHTDFAEKRSMHLSQSFSFVTSFYLRAKTKLSEKAKHFSQKISAQRRKFGDIARNASLCTNNMQWELLMVEESTFSEVRGRRYESARDNLAIDCTYISNQFLMGTSLNKILPSRSLVPLSCNVKSVSSQSLGKTELRTLKFSLISDNSNLLCSKSLWRFFHFHEAFTSIAFGLDNWNEQIVSHRHTSLCHLFFQYLISETSSDSFPIVAHVERFLNDPTNNQSIPNFLPSCQLHQQKIFKLPLINRVEKNEVILQCSEGLFFKIEMIPLEEVDEVILSDLPSILLQKCVVFSLNAFFHKVVMSIPSNMYSVDHSINRMKYQDDTLLLDFLNGLLLLLRFECHRSRVYFSLTEFAKLFSSTFTEQETAVIARRIDSSKSIFSSFFFEFSVPSMHLCLETYYSPNSLTRLRVKSPDDLRVYLPKKDTNKFTLVENESQLKRALEEEVNTARV